MKRTEAETEDGSEVRYPALGIIAAALRVLGYVTMVAGVGVSVVSAGAIVASDTGDGAVRLAAAILALVGGIVLTAFVALVTFAQAELISVLLDIEANTWDAAENTLGLLEEEERGRRRARVRGR